MSEIGGSRLTLDELSLGSPLSVTTARPRERARGHTHDGPTTTTTATVKWQVGEHFHFHTTRLKGFRSPETPHFGLPWNLPDRGRLPPEDEERGWSGSFLYRFLETPRLSRKMKGLGKSSGTALLWESRRYQMRMHYIGRRELLDFYHLPISGQAGESELRERRVGGRHDAGGFLPAIRMLVVVLFGPFWSIRIAEGAAGKGLPNQLTEKHAPAKESWKFQDATGREIRPAASESKAKIKGARSNQGSWRHLDTPPPPNPKLPKHGKSTLRRNPHDTTHKLEWGVSSGPVKIRDFQKFGVRRRLETASFQAATPTL